MPCQGRRVSWRRRRRSRPRVEIDGAGVRRVREDGAVEQVSWDDLAEVRLHAAPGDGSWPADIGYVLIGNDAGECVVPLVFADEYFLNRLQSLPSFDNAALIAGMTTTSPATFRLWRAGAPDPE
jgi:hypothetical protein